MMENHDYFTRSEAYLAVLAGEEVETLPEPLTRAEMYLARIAEGTVAVQRQTDEMKKYLEGVTVRTEQSFDGPAESEADLWEALEGYHFTAADLHIRVSVSPPLGLCFLSISGDLGIKMPKNASAPVAVPFDGITLPPAVSDRYWSLGGGIEFGVTASGGDLVFRNRADTAVTRESAPCAFAVEYPVGEGTV